MYAFMYIDVLTAFENLILSVNDTIYFLVYRRLHSQLTAFEGDEDKTSVISERDEDLSTVPDHMDLGDGPIPPLFLHLTCTVYLAGHVQSTISVKCLPTCLGDSFYFTTFLEDYTSEYFKKLLIFLKLETWTDKYYF